MFSIGLFSTYLPYVILAMFYGLYVGVHSIMKLEQDSDAEESLAAKMIFSDHENTPAGADSKNFYYDQYTGGHGSGSIPEIQRCAGQTLLPIPHEDPVHKPYYPPLFSRPPPVTSL